LKNDREFKSTQFISTSLKELDIELGHYQIQLHKKIEVAVEEGDENLIKFYLGQQQKAAEGRLLLKKLLNISRLDELCRGINV
jgi:hypothetical protein